MGGHWLFLKIILSRNVSEATTYAENTGIIGKFIRKKN